MGIRHAVGSMLESTIGRERTRAIRGMERRARNALAKRLAMEPPTKPTAKPAAKPAVQHPKATAKPSRWQPPDPYVPHPEPRLTRHELLQGLHEKTRPRTYLEIGIRTGRSMVLSRTRSIGVDPSFNIDRPIHCDVQLVRATSDEFFAGDEPLAHFDGLPVDLAFIDGMHLSDFALRDFINIEPFMAETGVVVIDDVLPRNGVEAARLGRPPRQHCPHRHCGDRRCRPSFHGPQGLLRRGSELSAATRSADTAPGVPGSLHR